MKGLVGRGGGGGGGGGGLNPALTPMTTIPQVLNVTDRQTDGQLAMAIPRSA